jgi:cation diffusion facilitator CzcD-associated flavoprotein CzcO
MERLIVVGAGPHGLAVLVALAAREAWPREVCVIDPSPGWCTAWDAKLDRLDLDRLRSPQVHHPGVRPMQFRDLVESQPAGEQLALRRTEAELAPTPLGMRRLIDRLAADLGPISWVQGKATALRVDAAGVDVDVDARAGATPRQRTLHGDALVLAHNPSFPRIPSWASELVQDGRAAHASTIDIRASAVDGREVVIVGGGLTAACLALAAARRGAQVAVVTRQPLRARPYDVDASWLGPRRLAGYLAATPSERRALVDLARDGGTIPPRTLDELRKRASDPDRAITLCETVDVEQVVTALLHPAGGSQPPLVWLATGFEQDIERDPLVGPLIAELGVPVHGGLPEVDEALRLGDTPVFVTGPYAALGVGPACRNLAGARPAAARIARALAESADAAVPRA